MFEKFLINKKKGLKSLITSNNGKKIITVYFRMRKNNCLLFNFRLFFYLFLVYIKYEEMPNEKLNKKKE